MSVTKVGAALLESGSKGVDIASASTIVIGKDGSYFDITGTTGIGTMTVDAGRIFTLQFDGAVILTHSSTLYLAGAANFTTEANDHLTFIAVAANDVRQIGTGLKDGGSPIAAAGTTLGTVVASTSGTAIDFTSLPAGVKRITFMMYDMSTNGSSHHLLQLGDAGGIETSGYSSISSYQGATNQGIATNTNGMLIFTGDTGGDWSGQMVLNLLDAAAFIWVSSHTFKQTNQSYIRHGAAHKALSAELTQIRLTTINGSDVFDAGKLNIQYE